MNNKTIALIKEKNEEAFEQLYSEYKNLVYYVIFQIVKERDAAQRVLQDTFFTIYNKIEQYSGGNFKFWILTIAKNLAYNYYNRDMEKDRNLIKDNDLVEELPDLNRPCLGKYDDLLNEHFSQFEKDIIVYHIVFGYNFKEIANIMEKTPKYISLQYKLTLENLKRLMEEENNE